MPRLLYFPNFDVSNFERYEAPGELDFNDISNCLSQKGFGYRSHRANRLRLKIGFALTNYGTGFLLTFVVYYRYFGAKIYDLAVDHSFINNGGILKQPRQILQTLVDFPKLFLAINIFGIFRTIAFGGSCGYTLNYFWSDRK